MRVASGANYGVEPAHCRSCRAITVEILATAESLGSATAEATSPSILRHLRATLKW